MREELIHGGFILIARKLLRGGIMEKPPLYIKLWIWMVAQASHKDHGNLRRGEFFTNIDKMRNAMTYKVGSRIERPTRKQIRLVYEYLTEIDAIKILRVTHGLLITIVNYDFYQNPLNYEGNILKSGDNPESPSRGTPKGTRKGTGKDDITNCNYMAFPDYKTSEGHAERNAESPSRGTILTKKGIQRKDIYLCPQQEIVDLYHKLLPELPRVKAWTEERQKTLRARWKEDPKRQTLEWWEGYFKYVRESDWLMGNNTHNWQANLEWLIKKSKIVRVIEGQYHR